MARPVQSQQEGHDANGHVLASNFVGGNQTHLHLREGQIGPSEKSSNKDKKGKKCPCTYFTARAPKKVRFEKNCNLCKKHGGACTTHNTHDCRRFDKDGKEKVDFRSAKKGGKKANPVNQDYAQLTEKIQKLEKALKKSGKKDQKRHYKDSNSDSE